MINDLRLFLIYLLASFVFVLLMAYTQPVFLTSAQMPYGLSAFLIIEIPLAYYVLFLIKRRKGISNLLPLTTVGLLVSLYLLEQDKAPIAITLWASFAVTIYCLLVIQLLSKLYCSRQEIRRLRLARSDNLEFAFSIMELLKLKSRVSVMLVYELVTLSYLFWPNKPLKLNQYSYHQKGAVRKIIVAGLVIGIIEMFGFHMWLANYWPNFVWWVTIFELYGLVWMLGFLRAMPQRPVELTSHGVQIRFGILYQIEIPYHNIEAIRRTGIYHYSRDTQGHLACTLFGQNDLLIKLKQAQIAQLPYGFRKKNIKTVSLMLDNEKDFWKQLKSRLDTGCQKA